MVLRIHPICWILIAFLLSACSPTTEAPSGAQTKSTKGSTLALKLDDSAGQPISGINSTTSGTLTATITDPSRKGMVGLAVTFKTELGRLNPASGTALTNADGRASVQLIAGDTAGAGVAAATVIVDGEALSTSLNYSVSASATAAGANIALALVDTSGNEISTIRADAPGVARATLTDAAGRGLAGAVVAFETALVSLNPESGTVLTDANGVATVDMIAKDKTGAATISATATVGAARPTALKAYEVSPPSIRLGSGSNPFQNRVLGFGVQPLAAGATTSVTVNVVDAAGNPFTTPIVIRFSSDCVVAARSTIDASATTVNGQATVTYAATGCEGVDRVVATANFGGSTFTASGDLTVTADTAASIEFVSTVPTTIALKGAGTGTVPETAVVTFRVKSSQGRPLANQLVNFTLDTSVGGMALAPTSQSTNSKGDVSTTVQAGTVATSVRVTATLTNSSVRTQSGQLSVSTGMPDQDSFTLALSTFNPEALRYPGETVTVTAFLADHFNNPVPDGTTVSFMTEGGEIEPACITAKGVCSVAWRSQDPAPVDHRATILATAVGEESFRDEDGDGFFGNADGDAYADNGNGQYDEPFADTNANGRFDEPFVDTNLSVTYDFGELFVDHNRNGRYDGNGTNPAGETAYTDLNGNGVYDGAGTLAAGEAFTDLDANSAFTPPGFVDLPEAFLDQNENGVRDSGEPYVDFDRSGSYGARNGNYSGVLCRHTSACAPQHSINVRAETILVMSDSFAHLVVQDATSSVVYGSIHPSVGSSVALNIAPGGSATLRISAMDRAGQVLPAGTVIVTTTTAGTIAGDTQFTVPNTATPISQFSVLVSDDDAAVASQGVITVTVTTPKGNKTTLGINIAI